ncbi:Predicted DNA-binding protein, MmcQ/YjbR family [Nakamurella panacisegetis]|uniref:Predicted DNA-binding protein, MmcQ/YjbR family n=1 Tax=Nakamurella panacisegetis TaxID=1090615 RepID=A0A1H0HS34_9ACTN|nr:MmcQ/YjbR family DNA-binding protein [Nakamurella panacisegetis]SDO22015.1 Predicted DNA-binding protein, MmcQ/YjbR family [Nakamurella panacisegetis]
MTPAPGPTARIAVMCLALPDTSVRPAHGAPAYQVRGKTFATVMDDHHGSGRTELWVKGAPGAQAEWIAADPGSYYVPAYVGSNGWIGVWLDRPVDWSAVAELLVEGYLLQSGPRTAASVDPKDLLRSALDAR